MHPIFPQGVIQDEWSHYLHETWSRLTVTLKVCNWMNLRRFYPYKLLCRIVNRSVSFRKILFHGKAKISQRYSLYWLVIECKRISSHRDFLKILFNLLPFKICFSEIKRYKDTFSKIFYDNTRRDDFDSEKNHWLIKWEVILIFSFLIRSF
jgi:hypothetical protein